MKKSKRLFLALALIFGFSLGAPTLASVKNIAKAENSTAYYLQVSGFKDSATVGATYTLPSGAVFSLEDGTQSDNATIVVRDPYGEEVDVEGNGFLVKHFGAYSVEYTYFNQTQKFSIFTTEGKYSFKFEDNSPHIIPTIMNVSTNKDVVLPNPIVVNENGDEIEIEQASLVVTVQDKDLNNVTLTEKDGHKTFRPNKGGEWVVSYRYVLDSQNASKVLISEERKINVSPTYENKFDLKISHSTPPQSADTKTEVHLPSVTATNAKTNNTVNHHLEIVAEKIVYNENGVMESRVNVTEQSIDGRVFTPQEDGDYVITYIVTDFFGNKVTKEITRILDVKDTKAPEIKIVAPYENAPVSLDDYSHNIPSKASRKNLTLPAIWAEDNVDTSLEGLTLTRRIRRNGVEIFSTTENPNKELVFNLDTELGVGQVEVELSEGYEWNQSNYSETITVIYIAEDSAGNESQSSYFTITIDDIYEENKPAEIRWSAEENFPTRIKLGETLRFAAPVVTSEQARTLTKVEYAFADADIENENIEESEWTTIDTQDKLVYEVDVPEELGGDIKTVRVRAKAYAYKSESAEYIDAKVTILDLQDSTPVKLLEKNPALGNEYKQGRDIVLESFVFEDDFASSLALDFRAVALVDGKNIPVPIFNGRRTISGNQMTISDAKFFASFAGIYQVTIKATDLGGNVAAYTYTIDIETYKEQIEPHFSAPKTIFDGVMELGTTIKLPEAVIVSNLEEEVPYTVSVIEGPMNYRFIEDYEFEPLEEGTYVIEYRATVEGEDITATFQVDVADTTAPEIAGWENIKATYFPTRMEKGSEITIPVVGFTENIEFIDLANSKVEVRRGNITIRTINLDKLNLDNPQATLTLNNDAVFTITYTIKDRAKSPNTRTHQATISVGDTVPPVVSIDDKNEDFVPETAAIGSVVDLDLSKITVSDDKSELDKKDLEIILRYDGAEVENRFADEDGNADRYGYRLNQAGTYTLTIKIQDDAGNWSESETRIITVTAEDNVGIETTQIIGVVLIIVSALILAGAIVYFILSKKKADGYKDSSRNINKD